MEQIIQLLELMERPAFCVEDGAVTAANQAALARQITLGSRAADLLASGQEEYAGYQSGYLCLELLLGTRRCPATITMLGERQLFTLEPEDTGEELRILALAAQELREPLSDVMALVEDLPENVEQQPGISRGLYRLLRIVGNMSAHPLPKMEMVELNALLYEVYDHAQPACDSRKVRFSFTPSPTPVYSCADSSLLTRAIHNLLSNAMKFSPGGSIQMQLSQRRSFYQISLYSEDSVLSPQIQDPYTRFRREPGMEDPRSGLGMGMRLVRNAALAHGGTVLMDTPKAGGVRVTLSLPVRQDVSAVRSPRFQVSYTGDRDPLLVELSDVLPPEFYKF